MIARSSFVKAVAATTPRRWVCSRPALRHCGGRVARSSLFHHTTTRHKSGWFSGLRTAFKNVYYGDDHVNPRKILERKYLYLSLMANHLRKLRLSAPADADTKVLQEQMIAELEAKELEGESNVGLRKELESYMRPQVNSIFEAFQRVDQRLNIPPSEEEEDIDLATLEYKDILLNEYERTKSQILQISETEADSEQKELSERSMAFLRRKRGAIETLLSFHGWSDKQSTSSMSSSGALDDFGMDVSGVNEDNLRLIRKYQTMNMCRSALIREELGFSVLCLRSNIPGGGRGVFIDGSAMAGSLVTFQPGDVWPKEHLMTDGMSTQSMLPLSTAVPLNLCSYSLSRYLCGTFQPQM